LIMKLDGFFKVITSLKILGWQLAYILK
jgi:hypothetical protein